MGIVNAAATMKAASIGHPGSVSEVRYETNTNRQSIETTCPTACRTRVFHAAAHRRHAGTDRRPHRTVKDEQSGALAGHGSASARRH